MEWITLAVAYLAMGMGGFAWRIRGNVVADSGQKKRSKRVLLIFPELCLFWPVALFMGMNRRRQVDKVTNNSID